MWSSDENDDQIDQLRKGGPYQVNFQQLYKPIFICYVDIMFAIAFFFGSIIYFWMRIS